MSDILHLNDNTFEEAVMKSDKPVLVDFWATWCMPCRMLAPSVESMVERFDGQAVVAKVDVDECPLLSATFRIASIPTLMVFKDGQPVEKSVGVIDEEDIAEMIEKHL